MKKVIFALVALVSMSATAQDMGMSEMDMDKEMMMKDAGMIMHGMKMQHFDAEEGLITLGTTGKAALFVRELLEKGYDASLGFSPSPFSAGRIGYTDLAPVKLLTDEEAKLDKGFHGFAPETANVIINGKKYTFRMVAPVVVKDNFVVQGGSWAARYDLGQDMGEDGKVKLVKKIKISDKNKR